MADPTKYVPAYSYSGWQATNPSRPLPADEVDNDFANVSQSVNQTIDALKDVRRSDGKLKNQSVGPDQLSPALTIGFTFTGAWFDGASYSTGDGVVHQNGFYSARQAHTADVGNAPVDGETSAYWNFLFSIDDIAVTGGMSLPRDSFVGDGTTKDFTLSFVPLSKFNLFVQVGGVVQTTDNYSTNGNTLTFLSAPPNGYGIEARGFATIASIVTPEDGSVTTAKLADLSVTEAKLAAAVAAKLNGAMQKAAYDPSGFEADVFHPANQKSFTTSEITGRAVPTAVTSLKTSGYATPGDLGGATFVRISTPTPAEAWHKQSSDGAWWQIAEAVLNPYMFGAAGDGVADDYPVLQALFDAASALSARVHISEGTYKLTSGSPQVFSNTVVTGDGKGRSILVQPNYYSYVRPGPYVKENVVDWNALWMDINTSNVDISGLELRGPFWQPDDAGYTANPVQSWPASNGIAVRGADYQYRKGLPYTGENFDISVHHCHLEGWAEDAVQTDMVTNVRVERNTMTHCGRGGHRGYSCVNGWSAFNDISHLFPGDYLNNGNRMYGVEYTRTYAAGVRASTSWWIYANKIDDCPYWKGVGTHGGTEGYVLFNDIIDCHHGIGVDKGGFEAGTGIAPPRDIKIIGNRVRRVAPGNGTEGNGEGGAGHAIFIVAHDGTSTHMGRNLVVEGNIFEGWGCENLNGGAWIGNWDGVVIGPNVWRNNFGSAIRLRDTVTNINIGPQTFVGVTRSAGGNQRAISIENGAVSGVIGPQVIENTSATALTAFFLNNPNAGAGMTIQDGHSFINSGGGSITKSNLPLNERGGPFNTSPVAAAYVTVGTGGPASAIGPGITNVTWESTGVVLITLSESASVANNLTVHVTPQGTTTPRSANFNRISVNQVRVYLYQSGVLTDISFGFTAWAF